MTAQPSLRDALLGLIRCTDALNEHVARHPLDYARWTEPQQTYLSRRDRRKLLRMGNGGGKSFVALADVALRARKAHPYRPDWNARRGPTKQWIVSVSWSQLVPLMTLFRSFLGENELAKAPTWDPAKGWGKDSPTLVWPDGSTVGFRTMRQGPLAMAGAELDHILIDEPCAMEHYRELERRVFRRAGDLSMAMTPINAPGDLSWLRDLVAEKQMSDLNYPMNETLFRFVDDGTQRRLVDGTVCDAAWIAEQIQAVPAKYREIVINGGWEEVVVDGVFSEIFDPARHVAEFDLDGKEILSLGSDHGSQAFTETALLVAVDERHEYPHIYVLDEYAAPENTPTEADARAIIEMLKRRGLTWRRLKHAIGDIPHFGGRGKVARKSNTDLAYELAREMGLAKNAPLHPPLRTAKTGAGAGPRGSIIRGESWLHKAMMRPGQFTVHPRCVRLIESIPRYRGGSEDPHGHLMDALRYSLDPWINRGQTRYVAPASVVVG